MRGINSRQDAEELVPAPHLPNSELPDRLLAQCGNMQTINVVRPENCS